MMGRTECTWSEAVIFMIFFIGSWAACFIYIFNKDNIYDYAVQIVSIVGATYIILFAFVIICKYLEKD